MRISSPPSPSAQCHRSRTPSAVNLDKSLYDIIAARVSSCKTSKQAYTAPKFAFDPVTVGEGSFQSFEGVRHRFRRCELRRGSARDAEFGLPLGAPNGERPPKRPADENAKLLKRKRLAKYAARESTRQPTDEEFMDAGFGRVPSSPARHSSPSSASQLCTMIAMVAVSFGPDRAVPAR